LHVDGCYEASECTTAADVFEKRDALGLCAKGHLSSRRAIQRQRHQMASDAASRTA